MIFSLIFFKTPPQLFVIFITAIIHEAVMAVRQKTRRTRGMFGGDATWACNYSLYYNEVSSATFMAFV